MEGEPKCVSLVEEFIMSPEDIAHKSVNRFTDKAFNKYIAGQNEHGGCLVKKVRTLIFFWITLKKRSLIFGITFRLSGWPKVHQ